MEYTFFLDRISNKNLFTSIRDNYNCRLKIRTLDWNHQKTSKLYIKRRSLTVWTHILRLQVSIYLIWKDTNIPIFKLSPSSLDVLINDTCDSHVSHQHFSFIPLFTSSCHGTCVLSDPWSRKIFVNNEIRIVKG